MHTNNRNMLGENVERIFFLVFCNSTVASPGQQVSTVVASPGRIRSHILLLISKYPTKLQTNWLDKDFRRTSCIPSYFSEAPKHQATYSLTLMLTDSPVHLKLASTVTLNGSNRLASSGRSGSQRLQEYASVKGFCHESPHKRVNQHWKYVTQVIYGNSHLARM